MLLEGTLLKGYGGFYYVFADDRVWECSLRGRFRVQKQEFLPGDLVAILPERGKRATIEKLLPRRNSLVRPTIANVDLAFLVFALTKPEPDMNLLNRLLVQISYAGLEIVLVLTKMDLHPALQADVLLETYRRVGYDVQPVSNLTGEGVSAVAERIPGRTAVLAGPSGSGKSSLLNALEQGLNLKTGRLSEKLGRGKHTTRHVELLRVAGGLVADTPGFSSLYLPEIRPEELQRFFPEIAGQAGNCRFKSCVHDKEPECRVKEAVVTGDVNPERYGHYLDFLQELKERRPKYSKEDKQG